jgi:hypothetical protein
MTASLRIICGLSSGLTPERQLQILRRCAPLDDSVRVKGRCTSGGLSAVYGRQMRSTICQPLYARLLGIVTSSCSRPDAQAAHSFAITPHRGSSAVHRTYRESRPIEKPVNTPSRSHAMPRFGSGDPFNSRMNLPSLKSTS